MFNEVNGLPVHALAVHAAVVAVPLAALLGVLFVIPRTRQWARLPMLLVSLAAAGTVFVTKQSGVHLKEVLQAQGGLTAQSPVTSLVKEHERRGNLLFILVLVFAGVAVAAYLVSASADRFGGALGIAISVFLLVASGAVAYQTYRVGDIGARAVWNPGGQVNYSMGAPAG